jgi:hypothetical protein
MNLVVSGLNGMYGMQLIIEYIQCYYLSFGLGILTTLAVINYKEKRNDRQDFKRQT